MQKTDFPHFTAVWSATCELYGKQPSDAALGMAFRALYRYDLADVKRALDAHINDPGDGRFMPKPADLVRHIDGDPESRSLQAWSKVENTIERIGSYGTVVFDEPAIMACIEDMGGWIELCKITNDELPFKRNEFTKRYKGYLNRPPERYPSKLIGVTEASNSRTGHMDEIPEPVLIGDTRQALLVHQSGSNQKKGPVSISHAMAMMKLEHKESE